MNNLLSDLITSVYKSLKMSVTEIKSGPIPFKIRLLSTLRSILDFIGTIFFKLYYGTDGKKVPPITDDILRQPAVEVARKIRNKQVCDSLIYIKFYTR